MKLTGAQILCESLVREGVEVMFGFPGGSVLPFYDALPKYSQLRHILVRHEQGSAHAADGYARVSGKVGVCIATSGPGATNLVTGIANAYLDSAPMVAITGQVARPFIGKDAFQEIDITGITLPITKHNYMVMAAADMATVVREAFHIARTGRPGPVLIDIPRDVFIEEAEFHYPDRVNLRGYKPTIQGHPGREGSTYIRGLRRAQGAGGKGADTGGQYPSRARLLPTITPVKPWHARDAWPGPCQPGGGCCGPHYRNRDEVR